jgi:hypothetical protein
MCAEHTPAVTGLDGKPVSREFSGLGLADDQAAAFHCEEHDHVVKGSLMKFVIAGAAVAVVGIIVAISSLVAGLVLILAGGAVAVLCYRAHQRRMAEARDARPAFPVVPALDSASVRETLHGQIRLADNGDYTSPPNPVSGEVEVAMTLTRSDRERLEDYRHSYGVAAGEPVDFSAGFAVLDGEQGLTLAVREDSGAGRLPGDCGLWFHGNSSRHPLFGPDGGGSAEQWTARFPYALQVARKPRNIPIWLVPSLVPASDQRTLEIDVRWVKLGEDRDQLSLSRFEQIELIVPKEWGNVERVTPNDALISDPDEEIYRTITWKQLGPDEPDGQNLTLAIRFEEQIKLVDALQGQVQAFFGGTLSGVKGIRFYQPQGAGWQKPPTVTVETEIRADFELSLNSIRYQDERVVPDHNKDITDPREAHALDDEATPDREVAGDGRVYRPEVEEFPGVIPDYRTVIELTNDMSKSGYYIKRVTENQPGGSGRANLVNRVWDIVGRLYNGVFPVDFHITLAGEEEYQGGVWAHAGDTSARISVRGSYVDEGMERKIEGVWSRLREQVEAKMSRRQGAVLTGARPDASSAPPPAAQPAQSAADDRISVLRKRLDSLADALLAGTITQDMYRELKTEAQAEIDRLQAEPGRG